MAAVELNVNGVACTLLLMVWDWAARQNHGRQTIDKAVGFVYAHRLATKCSATVDQSDNQAERPKADQATKAYHAANETRLYSYLRYRLETSEWRWISPRVSLRPDVTIPKAHLTVKPFSNAQVSLLLAGQQSLRHLYVHLVS